MVVGSVKMVDDIRKIADDRPRGGDPRVVLWAARDSDGFISLANRIRLPLPSPQIDLNTRLQRDAASHPTCPSQPLSDT